MSAFIVDYKDVDNVLNVVDNLLHKNWGLDDYMFCKLLDVAIPEYKNYSDILQDLGVRMLTLNIDAVNSRYDEDIDYTYAKEFKYNKGIKVSTLQGIKSLKCIIYQCSEDGAIEQDFYKTLTDLKNMLCEAYITDLQEYEDAKWADCYEFASR